MKIVLLIIIVILAGLLIYSLKRNSIIIREKEQLIQIKETALCIANRVVNTSEPFELYQYILDSCIKLIPNAKLGSILMFNSDGFLVAKASVGFNREEIKSFRIRLEESFLYIATGGRVDRTVIINRIEEIGVPKIRVRFGNEGLHIKSTVSSPLRINGELAGMLCIDGDQNDMFSEKDIYTLDYMANQIGIVIRNQRLYSEILRLSKYDSLSRLLNRDSFDREAEKLLNDPSKDRANLHFVLMDLDDLKNANDTIGHHFGDEVIKSFSEIVAKHLGTDNLFARYGGDEFAAIVKGDQMTISHTLEDANTEFMDKKIGILTTDFIHSFSYGIASFLEAEGSLDTLYKLADKRMYEVKNRKKRS